MRSAYFALKFFHENVLNTKFEEKLPPARKSLKLPIVLSKEEVIKMIDSTNNLKHKLVIMFLYYAGDGKYNKRTIQQIVQEKQESKRTSRLTRRSKNSKDLVNQKEITFDFAVSTISKTKHLYLYLSDNIIG